MSMIYTYANAPASAADIQAMCEQLGLPATCWLGGFWAAHNGAMLNDLVVIYATDDIAERNQTYDVGTSFPDHVSVGDDSGGRLILMPKSGAPRFHLLDAGDPFIEDADVFDSLEALVAYVVSED
ncbi:hypothetical protein FXN63_24905 [Pigmentiphaga aceris]|uniref:SMI1/KNR4 family protein n=1 Tax=Pigmentiphaga aceris TaxID=1940612 RepID=A0A5C0B500_9BURK|nr:hypothetical protein [Pigmentiphaga aceris]QEI08723.1 hypothetical protein FXN63_24905 [Pigmentiphaga aceris]